MVTGTHGGSAVATRLRAEGPDEGRAPRPSLSLGSLLAIAFGLLVALSVGLVLTLSVRANFVNTISLLNVRAVSLIEGMEQQIAAEAAQAERAVRALSRLQAEYPSADGGRQRRAAFAALLEAAPAVEGLVLERNGERAATLFRDRAGGFVDLPDQTDPAMLHVLVEELETKAGPVPGWGTPAPVGRQLFHNVSVALPGNGGVAVAFVGQDMVSQIMKRLSPADDATVFLLTEGGEVISHSRRPELFAGQEIMSLDAFPDPVLRRLPGAVENEDFSRAAESGIRVFTAEDNGVDYTFLTRRLEGYSARPFTLGVYFASTDIGAELLRAVNSLLVGLAGLIVSVGAAILLGKAVSRPMAEVAATAARFSDFELGDIAPLPRSHIHEIDRQAVALNRMHKALQQFARYVPRELVARLMRTGEDADRPVEREVTILFTDIVSFTAMSERMSAPEVAQLLNRHFEMIAEEVEAHGGTIDKFMGDSVMAFWGAPEADPDHALHAVRAAEAVMRAVQADNAGRRARGEALLRVRMGLHTGRVVVGNIGSRCRQNYTVIGDPVNVAQRLEQLARDVIAPDQDTVALVSSDVVDAVGDRAHFTQSRSFRVRGREDPIGVCTLKPGAPAPEAI